MVEGIHERQLCWLSLDADSTRFSEPVIFRMLLTCNRLWMKGSLHEAVSHKPQ
jgi:hypothetical protein